MLTINLKTVVAVAIGLALFVGGPASAATIDYIFTGLGTGTLGTSSSFGGSPVAPDASFTFTIVGDTGNVTTGSPSGPPDFNNPFGNAGAATFVSGSLSANLSNTKVSLFNDNATSTTFPSVGFFQTSPAVVGEALGSTVHGVFGSYDLTTAFALINSGSPNFVSFIPQTFATDSGDLTFTNISELSFEAIIPNSETPLPATLPLFASGLGALGLIGWRRKRKAEAV